MDAANTNLLIGSISATATVSAAFIYYYTLNELKRQRENTYRPYLFIDKTFFNVTGVKRNNYIMPLNWNEENKDGFSVSESDKNFGFGNFSLKCYNIGFGAATNVIITFSYEIDKFIDQINELKSKVPVELRIDIERKGMFISLRTENKDLPFSNKGIMVENNLEHYLSYILPVNIKNEFSGVKLPMHFLELLNIYVFYLATIEDDIAANMHIPAITTEIKYNDISNRKIVKDLTIVPEIAMWSTSGYSGQFLIFTKE